MERSFKDTNKLSLYIVMVANFTLFYIASHNDLLITGRWFDVARNIDGMLPAGFGLILTGIINAQLSAEMKSRIVFMRWRNPLPGCEAFSRHAKNDARIEMSTIRRVCGPLPTDPREQNALWYRIYKSVESEPAVAQVHRSFLFTRDYACIALMLAIVFGTLAFFQITVKSVAVLYVAALILQFLLASHAARNHGRRFVTTVLSIKAALA